MKKLFSVVSKLSAKRFAELHSDWPKLLFGSHALVRGHRNLKCVLPILQQYANKMRPEGHRFEILWFNFTKLGIKVQNLEI